MVDFVNSFENKPGLLRLKKKCSKTMILSGPKLEGGGVSEGYLNTLTSLKVAEKFIVWGDVVSVGIEYYV